MSEATEQSAPVQVSRQDAIAAAAAAADVDVETPTPEAGPALTKEDVAGKPAPETPAVSDRELVAPSIREFLRAQQPAPTPSPLEQEIADLRGALDGLANKGATDQELSVEQKMLAKLEALEKRDADREEAAAAAEAEEAYNSRVRAYREGVVANIDAQPENFPAVIALGQQGVIYDALVQRTQEGKETSEVEIASEVEAGLREVYETLQKTFGTTTPSKDSTPSSERKVTLTPGLAGADEAPDLENMSRSERIEYLWAKNQQ